MREFRNFFINGLIATFVHFAVLSFGAEVLKIPVFALANLIASVFGITASFIGNRYFVFNNRSQNIFAELKRFIGLYVAIACIHAGFMYLWADLSNLDYRIGFVVATGFQILLSFFGNKHLVFVK